MHKLPAGADQVSRYSIMDKTLADYISRTIARLEAEKQKPVDTKENQYPTLQRTPIHQHESQRNTT